MELARQGFSVDRVRDSQDPPTIPPLLDVVVLEAATCASRAAVPRCLNLRQGSARQGGVEPWLFGKEAGRFEPNTHLFLKNLGFSAEFGAEIL